MLGIISQLFMQCAWCGMLSCDCVISQWVWAEAPMLPQSKAFTEQVHCLSHGPFNCTYSTIVSRSLPLWTQTHTNTHKYFFFSFSSSVFRYAHKHICWHWNVNQMFMSICRLWKKKRYKPKCTKQHNILIRHKIILSWLEPQSMKPATYRFAETLIQNNRLTLFF